MIFIGGLCVYKMHIVLWLLTEFGVDHGGEKS